MNKVLIFGVGGLGCPLSIYLANLGIGNIGIVDDDKVELSNLNRQIIFSQKDIDEKSKSINLNTSGIEFFETLLFNKNLICRLVH